jgi:hypothetical protein
VCEELLTSVEGLCCLEVSCLFMATEFVVTAVGSIVRMLVMLLYKAVTLSVYCWLLLPFSSFIILTVSICFRSRLGCQIIMSKDLDGLEVHVPASVNDART